MRGELQEAHEKLLRMPYSNTNIEQVFVEAEKQIKVKEHYSLTTRDKILLLYLNHYWGILLSVTLATPLSTNGISVLPSGDRYHIIPKAYSGNMNASFVYLESHIVLSMIKMIFHRNATRQ